MGNQLNFQSATMELLKRLKSKKEVMQARHARELEEIDSEIEAVSITVRLLRETPEGTEPAEQPEPAVIPNNLSGKSAREACIEIAKKNKGIVHVIDAKKALIAAGVLKESKNTWAIIYTTLQRSKEFEKAAGTGRFRLIEPESQNPQASLLQ